MLVVTETNKLKASINNDVNKMFWTRMVVTLFKVIYYKDTFVISGSLNYSRLYLLHISTPHPCILNIPFSLAAWGALFTIDNQL